MPIMKRCRILPFATLPLLLVGAPLAGQITIAVSAGTTVSQLAVTGAEIVGEESRTGISLGASLTLPLSRNLALRLGGAYSPRGNTLAVSQLGDLTYRLDYLEFSALGRASVPVAGGPISLHLLAGPAVGFRTSCEGEVDFEVQQVTIVDECDYDGSEYDTIRTPSKTLDFGMVGGVGADFMPTQRLGFSLDLLYTLGLRSIYDGDFDRTAKNRAVTVQAGLVFRIG